MDWLLREADLPHHPARDMPLPAIRFCIAAPISKRVAENSGNAERRTGTGMQRYGSRRITGRRTAIAGGGAVPAAWQAAAVAVNLLPEGEKPVPLPQAESGKHGKR